MKTFQLILITTGCLLMLACSSANKNSNYVPNYQSALGADNGETRQNLDFDKLANLYNLFGNLKNENLEQFVFDTYATIFYFNDTLHTFTSRPDLAHYLSEGANRLDAITIEFKDVASSGENYYVRWQMEMEFSAMGKDINTSSIGISQIRFDENGKIVFHQDFWDNTNGFFGHLPILGGFINKVRKSVK